MKSGLFLRQLVLHLRQMNPAADTLIDLLAILRESP
jgi:hypothetical protein